MDNFNTTSILFQDLLSRGTLACGTVHPNRRGLPTFTSSLNRGDAVFLNSGDLTLVRWQDKQEVLCLSTFHGNQMVPFTTRRRDEDVDRPEMITDYNGNMGGVDLMDQLLVYYALGRKSMKLYKRIFWRIIDIAVVNAYILFSICHPTVNMEQKAFHLKLADALVEEHVNARADPDCDVITRGCRVSSGQA